MKTLQVFVISWAGQHDNAVAIADAISSSPHPVAIVYSDPNPQLKLVTTSKVITRSNELFWADKFKGCLEACSSDLMMVIHADCTCKDWSELVARGYEAASTMPNGGVWAPIIEGTPWPLERTELVTLNHTPISIVAQTDALVFCITKPLIERMRVANYDQNIHGWGIDWMLVSHAYATGRLAVVDRSVIVKHPYTDRGYKESIAQAQMDEFLGQLTLNEFVQYTLLRSHVNRLEPKILES